MSSQATNNLKEDIHKFMTGCKTHSPPNMQSKLLSDGIHLNDSGITCLKNFLADTIITKRQKVFSERSGRVSYNKPYSRATQNTPVQIVNHYSVPAAPRQNYVSRHDHDPPDYSGQFYPQYHIPHMNMQNYPQGRDSPVSHVDSSLNEAITQHVLSELKKQNIIHSV